MTAENEHDDEIGDDIGDDIGDIGEDIAIGDEIVINLDTGTVTGLFTDAHRAIEAVLMVADEPVEAHLLAQLLEIAPARVEELCTELAERLENEGRGFVLQRVAGGYRFASHPELAPYVERFAREGQPARLSAAALETLAIVAYKQPVSRAQVASIRGVNVDAVMRTLQQRGYVEEVARDPGPGQALLYGTTRRFLEHLGLDGLDGLPPLADFVPPAEIVETLEKGLRPGG
jgi:segregation and condensation protein B